MKDTLTVHSLLSPVTFREIERRDRRSGYSEIGYHHVITRDGEIHRGRSESSASMHDALEDAVRSISVLLIGEDFTPHQIDSLRYLAGGIGERHTLTTSRSETEAIPQSQLQRWLSL